MTTATSSQLAWTRRQKHGSIVSRSGSNFSSVIHVPFNQSVAEPGGSLGISPSDVWSKAAILSAVGRTLV